MFNSLHPICFVTLFSLTSKYNVLKPSFQILMWRGVLLFSILLWRCGLVLASHLGDPGVFILQEKLEQLQLDVLTPPSGRTRRLATWEPVKIPVDLDLDSLYLKVLCTLCFQMRIATARTRSALVKRLKEVREVRRNVQPIGAPPPFQNGGDNVELQQQFSSYNNKS